MITGFLLCNQLHVLIFDVDILDMLLQDGVLFLPVGNLSPIRLLSLLVFGLLL